MDCFWKSSKLEGLGFKVFFLDKKHWDLCRGSFTGYSDAISQQLYI